jgi:hypothetical protein
MLRRGTPRSLPDGSPASPPELGASPSRLVRRCDRGWSDSVLDEFDFRSHVRKGVELDGRDSRPDHPHADPRSVGKTRSLDGKRDRELLRTPSRSRKLKTCEALSPPEWVDYSDHGPIIASFGSEDG